MRRLLLASLLLAPLAAHAGQDCKFEAPRELKLDLAGVRQVQFDVNAYDLHVNGSDSATSGDLSGRACASDKSILDKLTVTQHREGDRLIVQLAGEHINWHFGSYSADLDINVTLPSKMPVAINVGSGDGWVRGVQHVEGHVGSGDLHVNDIAEVFIGSVGSGDMDGSTLGSLQIGSVGSGDAKFHDIKGDAKIGSIGSGDVTLQHVGGNVRADTLGSGDLSVHNVRGDFSLGAKGSGDVHKSEIAGKVSVPRDDDD